MIVQGKYIIESSIQNVWNCLMDPEVLRRIVPGISELTRLGDDKYNVTSKIKIGPVKGKFVGQMQIKDKTEKTAATLVINQKSNIGNVFAEIKMELNAIENTTEIHYTGEAKMSGKIAMIGQRIVGGVISSLSRQFFTALNNEVNS